MIVVPTLSPAALIRGQDGDRDTARFLSTVIGDVRKALRFKTRLPDWDESVIWQQTPDGRLWRLFPTAEEVARFCERVHHTTVAVDVEATGADSLTCKLICIGIASENGEAMCIPILQAGGQPYWNELDAAFVHKCVAFLLRDKRTPKVFHNGSFDTIVLGVHGFPVEGWEHDTMQAHHCYDGELPHSLAFVSSILLESPYWKEDSKGHGGFINVPDETLRSYNLRDVLCTIRLLPKLLALLKQYRLERLYREEIELCHIMAEATVQGVEVDLYRRYWIFRDLKRQREAALKTLKDLSGDPDFKPQGPKLVELLFTKLKFPIVAKTDKGAPATDKKAMTLLALHARSKAQRTVLKALIRFRKVDKLIGTYVGDPIEGRPGIATIFHPEDGTYRVHAVWKLLPVTGRLSSSPNMQNLPRFIRKMFKARKRHKFVAVDLSQAELRGIAYYSHDPDLLESYEKGYNLHTINATLLLRIRNPGVDSNPQTEAYLAEACPRLLGCAYDSLPQPEKDQWEAMRRQIKSFVFADNYDASAQTIYEVMKAQRDKETDEPLFPTLQLMTVEAYKTSWEAMHAAIAEYWEWVCSRVAQKGYFQCEVSDRIRWFRAGQKRNEVVNFPIQTLVAGHMNKATVRIAHRLKAEAPGARIVIQVHDALYVETPEPYVDKVKKILVEELSRPFPLLKYPAAVLPPDKPKVGVYLYDV